VARETQSYIEARPRDLQLVAEIRGLVNLTPDEQRAVLTEVLSFDRANPIFDELALINPDGREVVRVSRRAVVVPGQERDRALDLSVHPQPPHHLLQPRALRLRDGRAAHVDRASAV
jgi:hypothetical protein